MFYLNSMKKFERLNNEKAKYNGSNYGPVFGNGWDFYINQMMTNEREQPNNNNVFLQKYEFSDNGSLTIDEIEVFQME